MSHSSGEKPPPCVGPPPSAVIDGGLGGKTGEGAGPTREWESGIGDRLLISSATKASENPNERVELITGPLSPFSAIEK